jgi:hypothetical protein
MKFKQTGPYSAESDPAGYVITWGSVAPPYFAHLRGQRGSYGGSLGRHESRDAAKTACATYGDLSKRGNHK